MIAKFLRRRRLQGVIWEYTFTPDSPYRFLPGQYANFYLQHVTNDARGKYRVFSFTSHPSTGLLQFAAAFPTPLSPYKRALQTLKPGDIIHIDEALGDLVLPRVAHTPLVFVAGGLGIASYIAMLEECQLSRLAHPVSLLWSLRSKTDVLDFAVLKTFEFTKQALYIAPERLSVHHILQAAGQDAEIYLSGSESFVENLLADLRTHGLDDYRIAFDYYTGYTEL